MRAARIDGNGGRGAVLATTLFAVRNDAGHAPVDAAVDVLHEDVLALRTEHVAEAGQSGADI